MGEGRDGGHVVHERRTVRRVREGHERRVTVDCARERPLRHREPVLGLHDHQPVPLAEKIDRPLQHVEVRGEVHLVGDDDPAARPGPERRHHQLEQVDRCGVRHDDVGRIRADQRRELRADPLAGGEPPLAPPPDQPAAPLAVDRLPEPRTGLPGQPPERIAVEVDEARVADDELPPETGQRVGRVQSAGLGESARIAGRRRGRPAGGRRRRRGGHVAAPPDIVSPGRRRTARRPAAGRVARCRSGPAPPRPTLLRPGHRCSSLLARPRTRDHRRPSAPP